MTDWSAGVFVDYRNKFRVTGKLLTRGYFHPFVRRARQDPSWHFPEARLCQALI